MISNIRSTDSFYGIGYAADAIEYGIDAFQRSILFLDVLRKRGNIYMRHLEAGQPPVLVFDYEMVLDGRNLKRPVNYAIVRILDRRYSADDRRIQVAEKNDQRAQKNVITQERRDATGDRRSQIGERRGGLRHKLSEPVDPHKRPIVVIDPRAGHGPGIGGSKQDSEIGVALDCGHPVYFILFYTDPVAGQTLADVQQAEVLFIETVAKLHPRADKPAIIGNCQAGWAAALIGADRPDVTGPLVFNGSPMSYWAGVEGANPMRYRGGLYGGVWMNSLACDLGNGKFDGAHLVSGFESLNPANTYWTKQYHLYANVDNEETRYLNFEKWWGGFFMMTAEEIQFIVNNLFVGNKLEQGFLELEEGKPINLKNFKDPIVVFASSGDNITPPPQALNWIVKVYGSVEEIKRHGQVIVYIVHEKIGHLGIFVSGKVAKKEHREIIGSVEMIEYLPPGLYEMVIEAQASQPWLNDYKVSFEARRMKDILSLDDGMADEAAFAPVAKISAFNDDIYRTYVSPWVKAVSTDLSAALIKWLHPLRVQRYGMCDLNPLMLPIKGLAPLVKEHRQPVTEDNPFVTVEKSVSTMIANFLDSYRDLRDASQELIFNCIYGSPWMTWLLSADPSAENGQELTTRQRSAENRADRQRWLKAIDQGGFEEAVVRIMVALASSNGQMSRDFFDACEEIVQSHSRLSKIKPSAFKSMVKAQSRILQVDKERAIKALVKLIPQTADRAEAVELANSLTFAGLGMGTESKSLAAKIKAILNV